jgi:2-methylcitrate dehydratase PrpD
MSTPYAQVLAEFVSTFEPDRIPTEVLQRSRQSVANCIAAALSAATNDTIDRIVAVVAANGGTGESCLFGRTERLPLLGAALVNGYMAHFNDYDDTHDGTVYHTNSPVVPPLLGLAAERHASGRDVLHSLALGFEASIRLGQALGPEHYDSGWHITGTVGTAGAALACSRLLQLDARHTNYALGFALTQASGLRGQMFGTAAKGLNAGTAAMDGLLSALLAAQDLPAGEDSIEGAQAYASAAARSPNLERITDGLGETWETPRIAFKPFASGVATHASIDAGLELRARMGLGRNAPSTDVERAIAQLDEVVMTIPARYLRLPRGRDITAGLQGKFSMYNPPAIAFVRGSAGPRDYTDAILTDPQIAAFKDVLTLVGDEQIPRNTATLRARLGDGSTIECNIREGSGSAAKPMSDAQIRAKLVDAGRDIIDEATLERLADLAERLEQVEDIRTLTDLASVPSR